MNIYYLLIGGNQGEKTAQLALARENIAARAGTLLRVSSLYETAAWGKTDQENFLNQALELRTSLQPSVLIDVLLDIEEQMGRRRLERYGSRIIDIDILFFNDAILQLLKLVIPHPEIQNRRFALAPTGEIAPLLINPVLGRAIPELLEASPVPLNVIKL